MKLLAIYNPKGGCGKTTSALNIGYCLRRLGYRVILIDLDPLASLSSIMNMSAGQPDTYQWLRKQIFEPEFEEVRGVAFVPAGRNLAALEVEMSGVVGRETLLKSSLADIAGYDYALTDCPPGFSLLNINALCAADEVVVPVLAEHLDLTVLPFLVDTLSAVRKHLNPSLAVRGLFVNRLGRRKVNKESTAEINRLFPGLVMKSLIRDNVSITESPAYGLDVLAYRPESHGAVDYLRLAKEIASFPAARL
jgi:chromosome partitioning protein